MRLKAALATIGLTLGLAAQAPAVAGFFGRDYDPDAPDRYPYVSAALLSLLQLELLAPGMADAQAAPVLHPAAVLSGVGVSGRLPARLRPGAGRAPQVGAQTLAALYDVDSASPAPALARCGPQVFGGSFARPSEV